MGDSRIVIAFGDIELEYDDQKQSSRKDYKFFQKSLLGDSTFHEVVGIILKLCKEHYPSITIQTHLDQEKDIAVRLSFFDCTYHPVREIIYDTKNDQLTGPNSITLQKLGWFPGGKLVVLRSDDVQGREQVFKSNLSFLEMNENVHIPSNKEYIKKRNVGDNRDKRVLLMNRDKPMISSNDNNDLPLPSQILNAVSERFDTIECEESVQPPQSTSTSKRKQTVKRSEEERYARLDTSIRKLDASLSKKKSGKQQSINRKVQQMLIKNRAQGNKRLREEDRFYLEVINLCDINDTSTNVSDSPSTSSSYYFFSIVSTIGKLASSITANNTIKTDNNKDVRVEALIQYKSETDNEQPPNRKPSTNPSSSLPNTYRRLPNNISLHDAQTKGYLNLFDRIIIRSYLHDDGVVPTPSILDEEFYKKLDIENKSKSLNLAPANNYESGSSNETKENAVITELEANGISKNSKVAATEISNAIQRMEALQNKKGKKKSNKKTSEKVRQMLMKSKAKGDKKTKDVDRYYVEVILVDQHKALQENLEIIAQSSYHFFRKRFTVEQIIKSVIICDKNESDARMEFLVRSKVTSNESDAPLYTNVPKHLTLVEAESKGFLSQFDSIVIRRF